MFELSVSWQIPEWQCWHDHVRFCLKWILKGNEYYSHCVKYRPWGFRSRNFSSSNSCGLDCANKTVKTCKSAGLLVQPWNFWSCIWRYRGSCQPRTDSQTSHSSTVRSRELRVVLPGKLSARRSLGSEKRSGQVELNPGFPHVSPHPSSILQMIFKPTPYSFARTTADAAFRSPSKQQRSAEFQKTA